MPTYTDKKGYKRQHSDLWSRKVAYHKIYLKNRKKYPKPFSEYEVHHLDGNKDHNHPDNLAVLTPEEHIDIHIKMKEEIKEYYKMIVEYIIDITKQRFAYMDFYSKTNPFNKKKFGEIVAKKIVKKGISGFYCYIDSLGNINLRKSFSTPSSLIDASKDFNSLKIVLEKAIKRKENSIYFVDDKGNIRERKKHLNEEQVEKLEELKENLIKEI